MNFQLKVAGRLFQDYAIIKDFICNCNYLIFSIDCIQSIGEYRNIKTSLRSHTL